MLTLDRSIGDKWLVTKGLASGDQMIVEGIQNVRPGNAVRAVPFEQAEKQAQPSAGKK
jgi:membrane fusion protein (multidrug efflux system)